MRVVIIYYHEVVCENSFSYQKINIKKFEEQMYYLNNNKQKFNIITFNDLLSNKLSKRKINIIISFDDGFKTVATNAHPILERLKIPYSIYLATSFLNRENYLAKEDINLLSKTNLVTFEAHTHNHINCKTASENEIIEEISLSDSFFLKTFNTIPRVFCFPYGKYSIKSKKIFVKLKRYDLLLGSFYGFLPNKYKNKILPRIGISDDDDLKTFKMKLMGKYNWKGFLQKLRMHIKH